MATSGTMNGNAVSIGGYGGNYYFINWQLYSQSVSGNYSTIYWQCYFHYQDTDAQLDNGSAYLSGTRWSNGGRVHNFGSDYVVRNLELYSSSFNIGHNANGTQSLSVSGGVDVYQSGRSSGSASWSLPTIPRYASITGFNISNITDAAFTTNVSVSDTCNILQYSFNGGGWVTVYSGNFTSRSFTLSNLASGTQYSMRVQVRRADSGLYTASGTIYTTTALQNNFVAFL